MTPSIFDHLRPSAAFSWTKCTARTHLIQSLRRENKIPKDQTSLEAQEGTLAHQYAETCFKTELDTSPQVKGEHLDISDEMHLNVCKYVKYVRNICPDTLFIEKGIKLHYSPREGTPDALGIEGTPKGTLKVHVFDLKYGVSKVFVKDNFQLIIYALAYLRAHEPLGVESVTLHIVQPRLDHYDSITYNMGELHEFETQINESVNQNLEGGGVFKPSAKTCQFCAATLHCPARHQQIEEVIALSTQQNPLTPDQIETALNHRGQIRGWLTKLEEQQKQVILDGGTVKGYALKPTLKARQWCEDDKITEWAANAPDNYRYTTRLLTPTQFEKAIQKSDNPQYIEEQLELMKQFIIRKPGTPRLVKQTLANPETDFDIAEGVINDSVV